MVGRRGRAPNRPHPSRPRRRWRGRLAARAAAAWRSESGATFFPARAPSEARAWSGRGWQRHTRGSANESEESGGTRAAGACAPTWRQGGARSRSMTSDGESAAKTRHIESNLSCQAHLLVAQVVGPKRLRMTTNTRRASEGRCAWFDFGLKIGNGVGRWAPPAATTGVKVGTAPSSTNRAFRLATLAMGWWLSAGARGGGRACALSSGSRPLATRHHSAGARRPREQARRERRNRGGGETRRAAGRVF